LNGEELQLLRSMVQARSGVVIDPSKTYFIETRLAPIARREGFPSVAEMVGAIRVRRDDRLMWAMTEALTSTETAFFRDVVPFTQFKEEILPVLATGRSDEPIRVWSAACSTGQEVFSLAMCVDEIASRLGGCKVELFASDISEACLEKAQAGVYNQFEVQRGLPARLLLRHFEKVGEAWRISPALRQNIRWRRANLLADLSALGQFDVIFCRYAVYLFDEPTRRRVIEQLSRNLNPGGFLVLGLTETAQGSDRLRPAPGRPGLYQRLDGGPAQAAA